MIVKIHLGKSKLKQLIETSLKKGGVITVLFSLFDMFIDFMHNAYIHASFEKVLEYFHVFFSVLIKIEILDGLSDHFRI